MPLHISKEEFAIWYEQMMEKHSTLTWIKDIYWRLEDYSCILVLRNKLWFQHAISKIGDVWTIIEKEKVGGFKHRLPKKQNRASRANSMIDNENNMTNMSGCLINVDDL